MGDENSAFSAQNNREDNGVAENKDVSFGSFSKIKSLLEAQGEWYVHKSDGTQSQTEMNLVDQHNILLHAVDFSSLPNISSNKSLQHSFNLGCQDECLKRESRGSQGSVDKALCTNRNQILRPLEMLLSMGEQPANGKILKSTGDSLMEDESELSNQNERKDDSEFSSTDDLDSDHDSDYGYGGENGGESNKNDGNHSNPNSICGDQKGKKKRQTEMNSMAERCRRKKLKDGLYLLRSIVPKTSNIDRVSILTDAIEYMKELRQEIYDLNMELDSSDSSSSARSTAVHHWTPTLPILASAIKDDISHSSSPVRNSHPTRVEVAVSDGRNVKIHMSCGRRSDLPLSAVRALDNLGLDIQRGDITCFNGFSMNIFAAEEGQDADPEQIRATFQDLASMT